MYNKSDRDGRNQPIQIFCLKIKRKIHFNVYWIMTEEFENGERQKNENSCHPLFLGNHKFESLRFSDEFRLRIFK